MRKFTLGLNIAQNTAYIEQCFKQKLRRIKFPARNLAGAYAHISIYPRGRDRRLQNFGFLKYYNALK